MITSSLSIQGSRSGKVFYINLGGQPTFLPAEGEAVPLPGAPGVAAVLVGPLVLAARFGRDSDTPGFDVIAKNGFWTKINEKYEVPALKLHGEGIETVVRRRARGLEFDLDAPGLNRELVPYYRTAHDQDNLYWVVS
jgi:hypothetical protein